MYNTSAAATDDRGSETPQYGQGSASKQAGHDAIQMATDASAARKDAILKRWALEEASRRQRAL